MGNPFKYDIDINYIIIARVDCKSFFLLEWISDFAIIKMKNVEALAIYQ